MVLFWQSPASCLHGMLFVLTEHRGSDSVLTAGGTNPCSPRHLPLRATGGLKCTSMSYTVQNIFGLYVFQWLHWGSPSPLHKQGPSVLWIQFDECWQLPTMGSLPPRSKCRPWLHLCLPTSPILLCPFCNQSLLRHSPRPPQKVYTSTHLVSFIQFNAWGSHHVVAWGSCS